MFTTGNIWVTTFAVMFGIGFIMTGVYYVNKLFINSTKDILVRFILFPVYFFKTAHFTGHI